MTYDTTDNGLGHYTQFHPNIGDSESATFPNVIGLVTPPEQMSCVTWTGQMPAKASFIYFSPSWTKNNRVGSLKLADLKQNNTQSQRKIK